VLKDFLVDAQRKAEARKRGGGVEIVSFEQAQAEERYQLEPVDDRSPDKIFEHRWTVVQRTGARTQPIQNSCNPRRRITEKKMGTPMCPLRPCPQCGVLFSAEEIQGLCPRCLRRMLSRDDEKKTAAPLRQRGNIRETRRNRFADAKKRNV
jgi:hypothetical protein